MLIEAARRAEAAAKEMLALVNAGSVSCGEMREALEVSKSFTAINSAFQAGAAASIAKRERHGDGGAQVLADAAGLSRREAQGQVKTAEAIEAAPAVRDALEDGRVSLANARRLAEALGKTSAADVEADTDLLAKAESMCPEQFAREARRWTAQRQDDGGEADYRRQRAKRLVRVFDTDDGMVRLQGEFDAATGRRIGNRLQAHARRLYHLDKENAADNPGGRRTFKQCMADALDGLTANTASSEGRPFADIAVVAQVDGETGRLVAEIAGGDPLPESVLAELMNNAAVTGVIWDTNGTPLWQGHTRRTATAAQRKALIARYGGCFHCGTNPAMCQVHHIKPVSQGGPTNIDNMVLICWTCHQNIHHHGWQIHTRNGQHTLHPPDRTHHGPAHAPEQPILHRAAPDPAADPPPPRGSGATHETGPHAPPNGSALDTPDPAHDAQPRVRPGPATARAALRTAKPPRDGPLTAGASSRRLVSTRAPHTKPVPRLDELVLPLS